MLVAELELRHSRAIAPTRRLALGRLWLPTEPAPGFGGVLLAGVVGAAIGAIDDEEIVEGIDLLIDDLEHARHVAQPRLRYRFQTDVHGLDRSVHRLLNVGDAVELDIDGHGAALPNVLGAIYAAGRLSYRARPQVFRLLRRATRWDGPWDHRLIEFLTGDEAASFRRRSLPNDERWALQVLGFGADSEPGRGEIQRRFRVLVRDAHPDHGGDIEGAGQRILELTEAKRILLMGV